MKDICKWIKTRDYTQIKGSTAGEKLLQKIERVFEKR